MDGAGYLGHDLQGGVLFMGQGVVRVFELLGNEDLRIAGLHIHGALKAFLHALADITGVMNQLDFSAVMTDQLSAFLAHGVGHDDDRPVAFDRADQRQADALVAAGGLHDDGVRLDQAFLFRLLDHVQGGARFNGTADVQRFHFNQDLRAAGFRHAIQANHRGIADGVQDGVENHMCSSSGIHAGDIIPYRQRSVVQ